MEMELIFAGQPVEMVDIAPTYFSDDQQQATEIITIRSKDKKTPWMATVLAQDLTWREKGKPWTRAEQRAVSDKVNTIASRKFFKSTYLDTGIAANWNGYIQASGFPLCIAYTREEAASILKVDFDSIQHVIEVSPKDRHPELILAVNYGYVWQAN
jgi:hypothetical protein